MDPVLSELLTACSTPGQEHEVREIMVRELSKFGEITETRWTGFYMSLPRKEGAPDVVLTAHMDSPGFIVRDIKDNGQLDIISMGGIHPQSVQPRLVKLLTSAKTFDGVLHLDGDNKGKHSTYSGFFGFKNKEEAEKAGVEKGDAVAWRGEVVELQNNFIAASHCDNRLGCYLLIQCAKALSEMSDLPCNVHFAATGCEEVGGRGARVMGQMIEPEIAICFDTTYEEGSVKMGKGTAITLSDASVNLPMQVRDQLKHLAEAEDIPLQFEVYNYAGTDASGFRDVGSGCLTIAPLIPSLNNHTPHEIVSLDDIESTQSLALAIVKNCESIRSC